MKEYQSLSHTRWDCKYHIVFIPKMRKKMIFGALRKHLGVMFKELASHKESQVVEGHLLPDHVHMCLSIPPKYAVANVVRARARSTSRGSSVGGGATSPGRCSGPEGTSSRPWGWTKLWSGRTSATKKRKTSATTR